MKHLINFSFFIAFATLASAQPGALDIGFGNNGIVLGQGYTGYPFTTALQNDGKIIVAGSGTYQNEGGVLLARYNTDGAIDASFGSNGIVVNDFHGPIDEAYSVIVQGDGKILVAGEIGKLDAGLLRYLPNGTLDSSFGENGGAFIDLGGNEYVHAMVLQTDGKIVVAGIEGTRKAFAARFLIDGTIDESFGNHGNITTSQQENSSINCMILQPDGKLIIGGLYNVDGGAKMLLIRYTSNGRLDQEFGTGGTVIMSFLSGYQMYSLSSAILQPDGKIIIAGSSFPFQEHEVLMSLARFESNGSIDLSFGNEGKVVTNFQTDESAATSVLLQTDNKIIATGGTNDFGGFNSTFALARYQINGSLDSSFGTNGLQTTGIAETARSVASVLQEDGKIVLLGLSINIFVLARYNGGDAILPITYNHFTAEQNKQTIALSWQTTTELNNRYFAIERSSNAVSYAAIAQVNSAGTGAMVHQYSYTDKLPLQGTNYYRLKQTDADGKYSYSKVVSINYIKPGTILLLPNPAKDQLTVKGLNTANTSTISLLDQQGRLLKQFTVKQSTAYSFSINHLAAGTYIVRVKDNNGVATQKFVKQ